MKSALPILVATAMLFGASAVQAAEPAGAAGATSAPAAPAQSVGATPSASGTSQSFGAQPGAPGSSSYDPRAALPSMDNQGSAISPNPGTSASGIRTPSTGSGN